METAEKHFEDNEKHDPNSLIIGQRVSKQRCIQLMEEYSQKQLETTNDLLDKAIDWFKTGVKKAGKLHSGNLAHDRTHLQGHLGWSAEFLEKHRK